MKRVHPDASIASWALRFAASLPGVATVLSGMSNEEQMEDNIKTFRNFVPLNEEEKAVIAKAQEALKRVRRFHVPPVVTAATDVRWESRFRMCSRH